MVDRNDESSEVRVDRSDENKPAEEQFQQPSYPQTVFPLPGDPDGQKAFFSHAFHFSVGCEGRFIYTTGANLRCNPTVPKLVVYDLNLGTSYQYVIFGLTLDMRVLHFYCLGRNRALIVGRDKLEDAFVYRGIVNHAARSLRLTEIIDEIPKFDEQPYWTTSRTSATGILMFMCGRSERASGRAIVKEYDFHGVVGDIAINIPHGFDFAGQPFYSEGKLHIFRASTNFHPLFGNLTVIDGSLCMIDLYTGRLTFEPTNIEQDKFPYINGRLPNMMRLVHHRGTVFMIARTMTITRMGCFHVKSRKWHTLENITSMVRPDFYNLCMDVAQDGKLVMLLRAIDLNGQREREFLVRWIKVSYTRSLIQSLNELAFTKFITAFPSFRRETPRILNRRFGIPQRFVM